MLQFFSKPSRKKFVDWASPIITLLAAANAYAFTYLASSNLIFHSYNKHYRKGARDGMDDAIWQHPYRLNPEFSPDQPNKNDALLIGFATGMLAGTFVLGLGKTIYYYKENPTKTDYLYSLLTVLMTIGFGTAAFFHGIKTGLSGNSPYNQGYYYGYQSQCYEPEKYCTRNNTDPYAGEIPVYDKLALILSSSFLGASFLLMIAANIIKGHLNREETDETRPLLKF